MPDKTHDDTLVDALRRRGVERPEVFLADFVAVATEALAAGEEIPLRFLGVFHARAYPARTGRNLRTGKPCSIPAHRRVIFRASPALLDTLNRRGRRRLGHA